MIGTLSRVYLTEQNGKVSTIKVNGNVSKRNFGAYLFSFLPLSYFG